MKARACARVAVDQALELSVVGSFSRVGYATRRALFAWDAEPEADLTGRVVAVTGASSGLGRAAATAFARRRAEVILVGRDLGRIRPRADRSSTPSPTPVPRR